MDITKREVGAMAIGLIVGVIFAPAIKRAYDSVMNKVSEVNQ